MNHARQCSRWATFSKKSQTISSTSSHKATKKTTWNQTKGEFHPYTGVSKNSGTPKSSILIGFSIINHPFWGTLIFGNTHTYTYKPQPKPRGKNHHQIPHQDLTEFASLFAASWPPQPVKWLIFVDFYGKLMGKYTILHGSYGVYICLFDDIIWTCLHMSTMISYELLCLLYVCVYIYI